MFVVCCVTLDLRADSQVIASCLRRRIHNHPSFPGVDIQHPSQSTMSLSSTPISIKPSASEIKNRSLSQSNLEIATRALSRDGLVVLEDLVDHSILDKLNEKMVQDAYELQSRKDSPFNYHKGNIQQDPLMTKEYFFEEVFTSEQYKLQFSNISFNITQTPSSLR